MTNEQKQLLLKDLCARLPHGVVAYASEINKSGIITDVNIPYNMVNLTVDNASGKYELVPLSDVKPYLRPMSSMTEEERGEYRLCISMTKVRNGDALTLSSVVLVDWLYAHHLDFRGLIPKGLALEAKEGMY